LRLLASCEEDSVLMPSDFRPNIFALPALLLAFALMHLINPRGLTHTPTATSTPPVGWNSWHHFAETIDDSMVRAQADAMVSGKMCDAGNVFTNIDGI
jgi:alpha-galactosidase